MSYRLRLLTTGLCNLRCDYCHVFAGPPGNPSGRMPPEVACAAIDAALAALGPAPGAGLQVEFYGGEPLSNWETLSAAVGHAGRGPGAGRLSYILNTNATLARAEHASFCSAAGIDVHVGIDGADALANGSRRTQTGRATLHRAWRGIERFAAAGCRMQFNTCLTAANIDRLGDLVDLACQFNVDRIYVARPDISSGASLGGKSPAEIARILLAARALGRTRGVELGGPWARAILSTEAFAPVPCPPPGAAGEPTLPPLIVDAAGDVFLSPYPDSRLGNVRSDKLRSLLGSAACQALRDDWTAKLSSCRPCSLYASCGGYLRGLAMYHQGNDGGFQYGCALALSVLDALPLAHGGERAFSDGERLVLSRQLQVQTLDGQRLLRHRLLGHAMPVTEDELAWLRQFAWPADPSVLPEPGPAMARYLEQSVLLPESRDEEREWLLAQGAGSLALHDGGRFCVFALASRRDAGIALMRALHAGYERLCAHPFPSPTRPVLVYLAERESELAALWGAATLPAWVRVFVVARRILVVRGEAAAALANDADALPALCHELAHVFLGENRFQLPPWLEEGVCEYLAKGPCPAGGAEARAVIGFSALDASGGAPLTDFDASPPAVNSYYRQSWSFVSHLVERHGAQVFFRFLQGTVLGDDYRAVFAGAFGAALEALEQEWLAASGFRRVAPRVTDHLGVIRKGGRCLLFNRRHGGAVRSESSVADLLGRFASGADDAASFGDSALAQLPATLLERLFSERILVAEGDAETAVPELPSPGSVANLRLNITEQCNMRCTYCYVDHAAAKSASMDEATALRAIEQFLDLAQRERRDEVCIRFFGGEPLLNWTVIERALAFIDRHATGIAVRKLLNTNALNLRPEVIRVLAAAGVEVIVSVDGVGATHDLNRRLKNGKGTFERVASGIEGLLAGGCPVSIGLTLTESNIGQLRAVVDWVAELQERFSAEIGLGVNGLSMLDLPAQSALSDEEKVEYLVDAVRYGETMGVDLSPSKVLHAWNSLLGRTRRNAYCAAVGDELTVNPLGDVSPCSALRLNYGHGHDLSAVLRSDAFKLMASRVSGRLPECQGCEIEAYCAGGCAADAHARSGSLFRHDRDCGLKRLLFRRMVLEFAL